MSANVNFSRHALNDRMDRLLHIATTIGWGDILCRYKESNGCYANLTSTGIVIIKNQSDDMLVTAYIASPEQASNIWRRAGYGRLPHGLYKTICANFKRFGTPKE